MKRDELNGHTLLGIVNHMLVDDEKSTFITQLFKYITDRTPVEVGQVCVETNGFQGIFCALLDERTGLRSIAYELFVRFFSDPDSLDKNVYGRIYRIFLCFLQLKYFLFTRCQTDDKNAFKQLISNSIGNYIRQVLVESQPSVRLDKVQSYIIHPFRTLYQVFTPDNIQRWLVYISFPSDIRSSFEMVDILLFSEISFLLIPYNCGLEPPSHLFCINVKAFVTEFPPDLMTFVIDSMSISSSYNENNIHTHHLLKNILDHLEIPMLREQIVFFQNDVSDFMTGIKIDTMYPLLSRFIRKQSPERMELSNMTYFLLSCIFHDTLNRPLFYIYQQLHFLLSLAPITTVSEVNHSIGLLLREKYKPSSMILLLRVLAYDSDTLDVRMKKACLRDCFTCVESYYNSGKNIQLERQYSLTHASIIAFWCAQSVLSITMPTTDRSRLIFFLIYYKHKKTDDVTNYYYIPCINLRIVLHKLQEDDIDSHYYAIYFLLKIMLDNNFIKVYSLIHGNVIIQQSTVSHGIRLVERVLKRMCRENRELAVKIVTGLEYIKSKEILSTSLPMVSCLHEPFKTFYLYISKRMHDIQKQGKMFTIDHIIDTTLDSNRSIFGLYYVVSIFLNKCSIEELVDKYILDDYLQVLDTGITQQKLLTSSSVTVTKKPTTQRPPPRTDSTTQRRQEQQRIIKEMEEYIQTFFPECSKTVAFETEEVLIDTLFQLSSRVGFVSDRKSIIRLLVSEMDFEEFIKKIRQNLPSMMKWTHMIQIKIIGYLIFQFVNKLLQKINLDWFLSIQLPPIQSILVIEESEQFFELHGQLRFNLEKIPSHQHYNVPLLRQQIQNDILQIIMEELNATDIMLRTMIEEGHTGNVHLSIIRSLEGEEDERGSRTVPIIKIY